MGIELVALSPATDQDLEEEVFLLPPWLLAGWAGHCHDSIHLESCLQAYCTSTTGMALSSLAWHFLPSSTVPSRKTMASFSHEHTAQALTRHSSSSPFAAVFDWHNFVRPPLSISPSKVKSQRGFFGIRPVISKRTPVTNCETRR